MDITTALQTILPAIDQTNLKDHERHAYTVLLRAMEQEIARKKRTNGFNSGDFFQ